LFPKLRFKGVVKIGCSCADTLKYARPSFSYQPSELSKASEILAGVEAVAYSLVTNTLLM